MAYAPHDLLDVDAHAASLAASRLIDDHEYGTFGTRRWVVELILDLVGYTSERDLAVQRAIEPACGSGAFLGPMVQRLAQSCRLHGRDLMQATAAIRACDLQPAGVAQSLAVVQQELVAEGLSAAEAETLAERWVSHEDFLLSMHELGSADYVIGNPPYIRLEAVSPQRSEAYRLACRAMGGRSDVYVGFFEVALKALNPGGALGFICADRWMRNQYGQRLRELVVAGFAVEAVIEMHDVDAFEEEVRAYPSVTIIRRQPQASAVVATTSAGFDEHAALRVRTWSNGNRRRARGSTFEAARLPGWFDGASSWPSGSPERLALVADLERNLPTLEDLRTATRVGIGVASGADRVLVVNDPLLVEQDRMLPLAMVRDTLSGELRWSGNYLVNPWEGDTGALVSLDDHPRLRAYLQANATVLRGRNVAIRRPQQWYRTIDRVNHSLLGRPKLLLPDIKAEIHPVLDTGDLYPHHNLYWVASEQWDLEVLGGLLLSAVAQMFIECYAVKMRGGYLRFQAQYLRRIRVPRLASLPRRTAGELSRSFAARDVERATAAALLAYGLEGLPE
jgi:adenine-specific DNA-methyltransferase